MNKYVFDAFSPELPSRMGACFPGERTVFRGQDLHADLGNLSWMGLWVFAISGRRDLSPQDLSLLEQAWQVTNYPDARLWNNRVAALAAGNRASAGLALAGAFAIGEARIFGMQPITGAAQLLQRARPLLEQEDALLALLRVEKQRLGRLPGWGRPVRSELPDERIPAMLRWMADHGRPPGPHWHTVFAIERGLKRLLGRPLLATYAPCLAALAMDCGLSAQQAALWAQPCLMAGVMPCYLEGLERPAGAAFALRCEQLIDEGPADRSWQDATAR